MIHNHKLLSRILKLWGPRLRSIRHLVGVWIPRLKEAGECTRKAFVNNWVRLLDGVYAVPLFIFLAVFFKSVPRVNEHI